MVIGSELYGVELSTSSSSSDFDAVREWPAIVLVRLSPNEVASALIEDPTVVAIQNQKAVWNKGQKRTDILIHACQILQFVCLVKTWIHPFPGCYPSPSPIVRYAVPEGCCHRYPYRPDSRSLRQC